MNEETKNFPIDLPSLQDMLKAGAQFGHETKRWNPKMEKFVFGSKNNIHIIDITQTHELLEKALRFLIESSRKGSVLFVGSKRQAASIIEEEAMRSGAYFVTHRWPGGLLTNFNNILQSLNKLRKMEEDFENGVQGRTKYEISKMKAEWTRLNRLYSGIKEMKQYPTAVVVIDPRYEIGAVVEAKKLNIPVIAVVDTNTDPDLVDYPIPGNDDALNSIKMFMKLFADAVLVGNGGQGVKHNLKDYSKFEVKVIRAAAKSGEQNIGELTYDDQAKQAESNQEKPKFEKRKPLKAAVDNKPRLKIRRIVRKEDIEGEKK